MDEAPADRTVRERNGWGGKRRLSGTASLLIKCVSGVCLLLLAAGLSVTFLGFPFEDPLKFSLGLLLGGISSVTKVVFLDRSLGKTVDLEAENAKSMGRLHALGRYFLSVAAVLIAVVFRHTFGIIGLILGILSLQFGAYAASFFPLGE